MTKREVFATVMETLGETFNRPLTSGLLEGYWMALEDLTEDEIKAAARRAIVTSKFMPAPSELLAFGRPRANPAVSVIQAWQAVRKAIDVYDWNVGSIDFGPLVNAVIRNLGGWDTLCMATLPELDNPGWLRKRFDEVYTALSSADPQGLHGAPLEGKLPPNYVDPPHPVVSIDGQPTRPRLEASGANEAQASITAHVRELADRKSPNA